MLAKLQKARVRDFPFRRFPHPRGEADLGMISMFRRTGAPQNGAYTRTKKFLQRANTPKLPESHWSTCSGSNPSLHILSPSPFNFSSPLLPLPSLLVEVGPLNIARGSEERCKLPSGVWGGVPTESEFGANRCWGQMHWGQWRIMVLPPEVLWTPGSLGPWGKPPPCHSCCSKTTNRLVPIVAGASKSPLVAHEPPGWEQLMKMSSSRTLGSIQHRRRQEIGILGNKSSVRQRSARSSPPALSWAYPLRAYRD